MEYLDSCTLFLDRLRLKLFNSQRIEWIQESSISDGMEEVNDEFTGEEWNKNIVNETWAFNNKLWLDKGSPKPDNIFTFLGLKCRAVRPRSITVIPPKSRANTNNR